MSKAQILVIGSGPNGLAAGIVLAEAGYGVRIYEAAAQVGGGLRSAPLTLPGFTHDVCATIHALGAASPAFQQWLLHAHGLRWVHPPAPLAHPFDDGTAVVLERSMASTAEGLGADGAAYRRLVEPFVERWDELRGDLLGPLGWPRHPLLAARFAGGGLWSAEQVIRRRFRAEPARALIAGLAAHAVLPLDRPLTTAFALVLAVLGHVGGWPVAQGGSQALANALASYFRSLGGEIRTNSVITSLQELPPARAVLCDVGPRQLLRLAGGRLPAGYQRRLQRYRYGPGAFKMDWALDGPIPWAASACARAATVHVGGSWSEIAASESAAWAGRIAERPFVIAAQPSLFDPTRAPAGRQTAWAYCHVPHGSDVDMTERIEAQIERFAPGFRARILARAVRSARQLEAYNPNNVGGDITGGVQDLGQLWARPVLSPVPYATPLPGVYLCSASTPPGGGVHGMCGYHAARAALHDLKSG